MEKTYVFDNGGNDSNGMLGLISSLCNRQGIDPGYLMAMCNQNGMNGGGWWAWIIILLVFGWSGFGGNGLFGGRGNGQGLADLGQLVNSDAGRDLIMQAIQGNANAISQLASTVHCDTNQLSAAIQSVSSQICNLGNTLGLGQRDIIQQMMLGNQSIASQLCECCCSTKQLISDFRGDIALQLCQQTNALTNSINNATVGQERGFSSVAHETQRQTCDIQKAIADSTAQILAGQKAAEFREIQREVQALRDERTQYQMSALLQTQSSNLINTLRPCPIPSYNTCNPWGCNGGYYGNGYPYGGGCCGNNNGCGCN